MQEKLRVCRPAIRQSPDLYASINPSPADRWLAWSNSSARAIRKAALPCLPRRCRIFAHKKALTPSARQSPDLYASINPSPADRWLAWSNSSARAIRKAALPCLPRRCRIFAHKKALTPSARQSPDLYASINPSPADRWLNCWLKKYKFWGVFLKLTDNRV